MADKAKRSGDVVSMRASQGEKHMHQKNVQKGIERLERHSGTGLSGGLKKEGGGGKFVWGRPGDEYSDPPVGVLDENDPNYDEDADQPQQQPRDKEEAPEHKAVIKKVLVAE